MGQFEISAGHGGSDVESATVAPDHSAYELAMREAVRALDYQRAALESLRTRVGVLLSGATIATSFLGGLAIQQNDRADFTDWSAIVCFALFAVACLRILWPEAESAEGYTASPNDLLDYMIEGQAEYERWQVERELALHMENQYNTTDLRHVGPLNNWFRAAIVLLVAEIILWTIAI